MTGVFFYVPAMGLVRLDRDFMAKLRRLCVNTLELPGDVMELGIEGVGAQ